MPPYSPELKPRPQDVPNDINQTPSPEEYKNQVGIVFEKNKFGAPVIFDEEHGRHKVYAVRGRMNAKLPRSPELQEITVFLYGNSADDIKTLVTATDALQASLRAGTLPQMEEHVAEALKKSPFLLAPRRAALPGFVSSRSLPEDVSSNTVFLLSYGDRVEEYRKMDIADQNRFHSAVKAGLLPLVFPRNAAQDALFVDKLLDIADDNHKVAEFLQAQKETKSRDAAAPEVDTPNVYPDALTLFKREIVNPYFMLGIRGRVTETLIDQAQEEADQRLHEMFTTLIPQAPNHAAGRALIDIHNILGAAIKKHADVTRWLESFYKEAAAAHPEFGDDSSKVAQLDLDTRARIMVAVSHGDFKSEMEKMHLYEADADAKKELEPAETIEYVGRVLTNPYLFVGLQGEFSESTIKQAYDRFDARLAEEKQKEEQAGKQSTQRYKVYEALEVLTKAYKVAALDLEENLLNSESENAQRRIRQLHPVDRYYAILALKDAQQGRR